MTELKKTLRELLVERSPVEVLFALADLLDEHAGETEAEALRRGILSFMPIGMWLRRDARALRKMVNELCSDAGRPFGPR